MKSDSPRHARRVFSVAGGGHHLHLVVFDGRTVFSLANRRSAGRRVPAGVRESGRPAKAHTLPIVVVVVVGGQLRLPRVERHGLGNDFEILARGGARDPASLRLDDGVGTPVSAPRVQVTSSY